MTNFEKVTILIPAYNPDTKLLQLVKDIKQANFNQIIIVNDGSLPDSTQIFDALIDTEGCVILKHGVNLGKGRALKTGFNHFLNHHTESVGVITIDADGQHSVEDMKKIAKQLINDPYSLVLGVRDFSAENIPFRSRFGNVLTRNVFRFIGGIKVTDTQTGLRGIPKHFIKDLMNVSGERFEFEMNMLLECKAKQINIEEVGIETIYIEENKSSHFNPIVDSIKIYTVFIKYAFSSLFSFGLDIFLFTIFSILLKELIPIYFIFVATIGARILSSLFNYTVNKNIVFKSNSKYTLYKYYFLSICQMLVSSYGVYLLYLTFGDGEVVIKIIVDTLLFVISFYIQRVWVFNNQSGRSEVVVRD
ncbi:bifunctional glycosyltransferase family 2/GtrA family protein [Bacillus sp. JJ1533]|uniref:bifunctional glycosyltransferase family 2/GtrA family protein n=1 Tax=Bacillus sp. JJ1533 TaxID=3122959 RepID=UPI002FFF0035